MIALCLVFGSVLSNTAMANLLLPVGMAAAGSVPEGNMQVTALAIAFTASLSMTLPMSTPPNALAYARGGITLRDMALTGALVGLAGAALILLGAWLLS